VIHPHRRNTGAAAYGFDPMVFGVPSQAISTRQMRDCADESIAWNGD